MEEVIEKKMEEIKERSRKSHSTLVEREIVARGRFQDAVLREEAIKELAEELLFHVSLEQWKRVCPMLSSRTTIEQVGGSIIVKTTFTDYIGSMSDGDTKQIPITYEVRRDGKVRMLSRGKTNEERGSWTDPTKYDENRNWH